MNAVKLGGEIMAPDSSYFASVADTLLTGIETLSGGVVAMCHGALSIASAFLAIMAR